MPVLPPALLDAGWSPIVVRMLVPDGAAGQFDMNVVSECACWPLNVTGCRLVTDRCQDAGAFGAIERH